MFEIQLSLQTAIFIDVANIKPTAKIISEYGALLEDKGFIPATFQEIGPGIQQTRLSFRKPDNSWSVSFLSRRINIEQNIIPVPNDDVVLSFITEANELYGKILDQLERNGLRMAFICTGLLKKPSADKLEAASTKFLLPLPSYKGQNIFEWGYNTVFRKTIAINGGNEDVNVITNIKRERGSVITKGIATTDYDTLRFEFDFNTIEEKKETRFNKDSLKSFLAEAETCFKTIVKEVEATIDG